MMKGRFEEAYKEKVKKIIRSARVVHFLSMSILMAILK